MRERWLKAVGAALATSALAAVAALAPLAACSLLVDTDNLGNPPSPSDDGSTPTDASTDQSNIIGDGSPQTNDTGIDGPRELCNGKDCLGGACVANKCQPTPLALNQGSPRALAIYGDHVYWTNSGTGEVMRAQRRTGGDAKMLAKVTSPVSIAVVQAGVFVADPGATQLYRIPLEGGNAVPLHNDVINAVATDDTYVYYTTNSEVRRIQQDGQNDFTLAASQSPKPRNLAVGPNGRIYFTNEGTRLASVPNSGGTVMCHFDASGAYGVAVDGTNIYETLRVPTGTARRKVLLEPCMTNAIEMTLAINMPFEITQDTNSIYFTQDLASGSVFVVNKSGGNPDEIAIQQSRPSGIAVAPDGIVYWANNVPNGAVMMVVR
jgi:hypothetical protein